MEHIRQSSDKHTPGSFNVAENVAGFRPGVYYGSVSVFPFSKESKEHIAFILGVDTGDTKEDLPELPSVSGFRLIPAPRQSLALNVDQTALDYNARPQEPNSFHQMWIAINSEAAGPQAPFNKRDKKSLDLRPGTLGNGVLAANKPARVSVHKSYQALRSVNKGAVDNHMLALFHSYRGLRWRLCQITANHTRKLPRAMPALFRQLPDRVAFNDPAPEPLLFVSLPDVNIGPAKRVPAPGAKPALSAIGIMTIFPGSTGAYRAVFF
jgi:hypothetical protein